MWLPFLLLLEGNHFLNFYCIDNSPLLNPHQMTTNITEEINEKENDFRKTLRIVYATNKIHIDLPDIIVDTTNQPNVHSLFVLFKLN